MGRRDMVQTNKTWRDIRQRGGIYGSASMILFNTVPIRSIMGTTRALPIQKYPELFRHAGIGPFIIKSLKPFGFHRGKQPQPSRYRIGYDMCAAV